jgi:competence protein ComEC
MFLPGRATAPLLRAILLLLAGCNGCSRKPSGPNTTRPGAPAGPSTSPTTAPLVVRVLDVGQGDAILVTNGASKVLIDGGPDPGRLGRLLDSLGLGRATIDVVILTHQHYDHYNGLRELFRSRRRMGVRYFFENRDRSANVTLEKLRDSVDARVRRSQLVLRDTDDPCGTGSAICTITLNGGATLHVMRPEPGRTDANDRSAAVRLVGPDSASFTMWLAGDAERPEIAWFDDRDYDKRPGMRVMVLKADHHGSCNGVSQRYLALTRPQWAVVSVGAVNDYGHMHEEAKALYARAGVPWYRTDENGTITIRAAGTPGSGYSITPSRGGRNMTGRSDRRSTQPDCRDVN